MFTIRENLAFLIGKFIVPKKKRLLRLTRNLLLLLAAALALEIFLFNFNYFSTLQNSPIDLSDQISLAKSNKSSDDGRASFVLTSDNHTLEFHNINKKVNSVQIEFDTEQTAQALEIKMQFTDEAHVSYFDTTDYTAGIPLMSMSTLLKNTQYMRLNTTGNMKDLRIEVVGNTYDVQYPLYLKTIVVNPNRPFDFNMTRFLTCALIFFLVYVFRPKSSIYKLKIRENDLSSKVGIVSAVTLEVILATTFLFFGSNMVGVATSSYNYGEWDGKSLVNTYEVGGKNSSQYANLARSFANGSLSLEEEPPDWLKELENPYDKASRDEAQKDSGQDYLFDVAYFNGKYYVYFGVVPVLLFYLPFYLITGVNFPTAIGVLLAALAFIVGITVLLHRFAKYHFKRVNLGIFLLLQIPLVACSGILYLLKFPTFYSLPIACALAFTVWGLYFWMRGRRAQKRMACFIAGSICMALVIGCRPQLAIVSAVAFPLFWKPYIKEKRIVTKEGAIEFISLIAPYLIVFLFLFIYNYARFGSIFDFGANYNLTVNDMTKRGMNFGRVLPAFFSYFLQTPSTTGVFPFLQQTTFDTTYVGQTIREATFGGIFACLPLLWLNVIAYPALKIRNAQRKTHTVSGVVALLIVGGILVAVLDAEMAGILQRYYADFSFMFLASAVLIAFILNENALLRTSLEDAETQNASRDSMSIDAIVPLKLSANMLYKIIILTVAASVLYSTLLCFVPETGWYSDVYAYSYVGLKDAVLFWT